MFVTAAALVSFCICGSSSRSRRSANRRSDSELGSLRSRLLRDTLLDDGQICMLVVGGIGSVAVIPLKYPGVCEILGTSLDYPGVPVRLLFSGFYNTVDAAEKVEVAPGRQIMEIRNTRPCLDAGEKVYIAGFCSVSGTICGE